ncbi:MAG: Spy/CpxP family protein refolding chaperone [Elusimicrobiota bacterium]
MKRILCAVVAAGLLAAGPLARRALADEGEKHGERAGKMMKERLGLSDDQAAKLKAAFEAEKTAVKTLREQSKEAGRKLEEEVRGMASDKDIQATLDQLDAGRKAMAAEHQKFESSLAAILKPYQRAKMRLLMAGHGKHRGGGWGRGREEHRDGDKHGDRKGGEDRHHDDD